MKTILVPTDFSECANNALRVATDIARKTDASVHIVHVYERPYFGNTELQVNTTANNKIVNKIKEEMEKLVAQDFAKGIKIIRHILWDIPITEIEKYDKVKNADLIVMGSHGCKGWKELFIGSNTEKIVRLSNIPVLVIKEKIEKFEMKNIVFASNFDDHVDKVFIRINKLFNLFDARIHLLKVNTQSHFEKTVHSMKRMRKFARQFHLPEATMTTYNDDSVEEGIRHFSNTIGADFIAMETHGRTGVAHLINGSITENLVNHVSTPVLSVKTSIPLKKGQSSKNYQSKFVPRNKRNEYFFENQIPAI